MKRKPLPLSKRTQARIDALVIEHQPLVRELAKHAAKCLPSCIDLDELVSIGNVALVERAQAYDANLHPRFAHYAKKRVFGAMIDAYRDRNYPRKFESIPEQWLGGDQVGERHHRGGDRSGPRPLHVPEQLVDPQPAVDIRLMLEREEHRVVHCIVEARRLLTVEEGRVIDAHVAGLSMREVGVSEGKSGAWACYTIGRAKRKLRRNLEESLLKAA